MDSCEAEGILGHVTFSSGWEWGYWLVDWSIARWSWAYTDVATGQEPIAQRHQPTAYAALAMPTVALQLRFAKLLDLHQRYLKDQNLMRFMASEQATDELPGKLRTEFAPQPKWRYSDLWRRFHPTQLDSVEQFGVRPLLQFADSCDRLLAQMDTLWAAYLEAHALPNGQLKDTHLRAFDVTRLYRELHNALTMTSLRARHRATTLSYLLDHRRQRIGLLTKAELKQKAHIDRAQAILDKAQRIATAQEDRYRWPKEHLGRRRPSYTAYQFGYLYSAHDLHWWRREQKEAEKKRFGFLFMNHMDFARIGGLHKIGVHRKPKHYNPGDGEL
jgi:hypothetical protein